VSLDTAPHRLDGQEPARTIDQAKIAQAVTLILEALGEDPGREGLLETPRRIAEMYGELFSGLHTDPRAYLQVGFEEDHQEMVILRDISFTSMCEHHFMPFYGHAHVAYIPQGRVVGLSKLARLVEGYAHRPQLQERLTGQIADALVEVLQPAGVGVVLEAEHMCMSVRGVKKPGSRMVTSATRGAFRAHQATRLEFLSLIGKA
jgi:GTP cyclohydrolase I